MKSILMFLAFSLTTILEPDHPKISIDPVVEDECLSCSIDFTATQNFGNCNGDCGTQPCAEVTFTVSGIYSCNGFYTPYDGFFIGHWKNYECGGSGSGSWGGGSPTYTTTINVCEWSDDSGQTGYLSIPVRLNYEYTCGGSTCYSSVFKYITMLVC